jgi:hypothetical protein
MPGIKLCQQRQYVCLVFGYSACECSRAAARRAASRSAPNRDVITRVRKATSWPRSGANFSRL